MTNSNVKATVQKGVEEIFNKKNLAYIDEFIMPDIVDHSAPPGLPAGIEGYRMKLAMFTNAFPDLHISYSHHIVDGEAGGRQHAGLDEVGEGTPGALGLGARTQSHDRAAHGANVGHACERRPAERKRAFERVDAEQLVRYVVVGERRRSRSASDDRAGEWVHAGTVTVTTATELDSTKTQMSAPFAVIVLLP